MTSDTKGERSKKRRERPPTKEEKAEHLAEVKAETDALLAELDELLEEPTIGEG